MANVISLQKDVSETLAYIGDQLDKKIDENTREMRREFDDKIKDLDHRINHRISALDETMKTTHNQNRTDMHAMEKSIINSITELKIENAQKTLMELKETSLKNAQKAKEEGEHKTKLEFTTKVVTFIVGGLTTGFIGLIFHLVRTHLAI
jgi:hypothetical protein